MVPSSLMPSVKAEVSPGSGPRTVKLASASQTIPLPVAMPSPLTSVTLAPENPAGRGRTRQPPEPRFQSTGMLNVEFFLVPCTLSKPPTTLPSLVIARATPPVTVPFTQLTGRDAPVQLPDPPVQIRGIPSVLVLVLPTTVVPPALRSRASPAPRSSIPPAADQKNASVRLRPTI